jgi:hypothetical protein
MPQYFGSKDGVDLVCKAANVNAAYLTFGKFLGIEAQEPENVDLDTFYELPGKLKSGEVIQLSEKK